MKKNFTLEIIFEAEIKIGEFTNSDDRCLTFIDEYINEFVKDPDSILTFYKIYLLSLLCVDFSLRDRVKDALNVDNSDTHYLKVADKCSPEVKEFIYGLYSEDHRPKLDNEEQEKYREILEDQFKKLIIVDVSFKGAEPPPALGPKGHLTNR